MSRQLSGAIATANEMEQKRCGEIQRERGPWHVHADGHEPHQVGLQLRQRRQRREHEHYEMS
jgi:hypothetical protein